MGTIRIENMRFKSLHGCFAEERIIGTEFAVDLTFEYNSTMAEDFDNKEFAVDYQEVYLVVKEQMNIASNLIENVAKRIANAVLTRFKVDKCGVKVSKLNPPLGGQISAVCFECFVCGEQSIQSTQPTLER
ncbi:MAG: dihydroneopterin aldolase [Bacteroidales bacterium]|jgi:dihydroneopterin aldolase|nr:dihydroneopterin aldolase [Bacteroidales bacterium]